eukprot:1912702-Pyramimonas_sp.AAC.1
MGLRRLYDSLARLHASLAHPRVPQPRASRFSRTSCGNNQKTTFLIEIARDIPPEAIAPEARRALVEFALAHCAPESIQPLLLVWRRLEVSIGPARRNLYLIYLYRGYIIASFHGSFCANNGKGRLYLKRGKSLILL